jgi:hypothetical protein
MEALIPAGLVLLGFFVGTFVFARVGRWAVTLYEILKDRTVAPGFSKAGRLASASILSSGLWIFACAVVSAYYVFSESWAVWVFAGFCGAIILFLAISAYFARKAAPSKGGNSA